MSCELFSLIGSIKFFKIFRNCCTKTSLPYPQLHNMNSRGGGYGMDAELARKAELKYDTAAEHEASSWLAAVTGISLSSDFAGSLKDGQILCMAINKIKPGTIRKIETSKMPFKQMENISNFLKGERTQPNLLARSSC